MVALMRMRLTAFVSGGRALPPLIAVLVVLGVIYGGGPSPAAVAYGYSACALFPVLAWLTKLVLDTEPDVQRRVARLAVGAGREAVAGLLTAGVFALAVCAAAMAAPWLFHGITPAVDLAPGLALGALAHVIAVPPALALGALSSRAVARTVRNGVTILVVAALLVIVLGLQGAWVSWLVPPVMATARALNRTDLPGPAGALGLTGWALAWCAVAFAGYGRLRRSRA
jgi:hypothetical protein